MTTISAGWLRRAPLGALLLTLSLTPQDKEPATQHAEATALQAALAAHAHFVAGGTESAKPAVSRLELPEPVDPALLAKVLLEQPTSYAVINLRPAWQFAEWNVHGSTNVLIDELIAHIAKLPPDVRVVFVDRDGSLAFAAAGAVMAKTEGRVLRALLGGLQRYHREIVLGEAHFVVMSPTPLAHTPTTSSPTPVAKKRGAGC